jgi:fido (protein-threonine AMPylation protein)
MIELYLDAAMKRVNWDGIDKDKVINAARKML